MEEFEEKLKKNIDVSIENLISRFGIQEVWSKINNLHRFSPSKEEEKTVRKKLEEFGLTYYEDVTLEMDKISAYGQSWKDGPIIAFEITPYAPFNVSLTLRDSYYEARDIYEYNCGPYWYDEKDKVWIQNDNWEAGEIKTLVKIFYKPEKMWSWIKKNIPLLEKEWSDLPPFRIPEGEDVTG